MFILYSIILTWFPFVIWHKILFPLTTTSFTLQVFLLFNIVFTKCITNFTCVLVETPRRFY